ncbi:hypothetical protein CO661_14115 [Sinorhizobium fredii]|uniref:Uncharacterized protein n=2 Tax=Rhizobium fredii TaxID=380 RepID=A0A2A6LXF2_RHIFR|nr:hypothetical protein CO661_14115 [Sinorhizobium fredii]
MQAAGMTIPQGIDPLKLSAVYGYALSGVPSCGLSIATQKLIKGEYAGNPDILLGAIPKPPIFAALCRLEARPIADERIRKREKMEAIQPADKPVDRSPEVMARIRARVAAFRQEVAAQKGAKSIPHEPMAPEREDMLRRILELPDARNVTAEQMAFRRGIQTEIGQRENEA